MVMTGNAAQAGTAVPDHHWADLLDERLDGGRLPVYGPGGQVREPCPVGRGRPVQEVRAHLRHECMMPTSAGVDRIQLEQIGHIDIRVATHSMLITASSHMTAGRN